MKAEEILDKHYQSGMHWKLVNRNNVLKAMHEYADFQLRECGVITKPSKAFKKTVIKINAALELNKMERLKNRNSPTNG